MKTHEHEKKGANIFKNTTEKDLKYENRYCKTSFHPVVPLKAKTVLKSENFQLRNGSHFERSDGRGMHGGVDLAAAATAAERDGGGGSGAGGCK